MRIRFSSIKMTATSLLLFASLLAQAFAADDKDPAVDYKLGSNPEIIRIIARLQEDADQISEALRAGSVLDREDPLFELITDSIWDTQNENIHKKAKIGFVGHSSNLSGLAGSAAAGYLSLYSFTQYVNSHLGNFIADKIPVYQLGVGAIGACIGWMVCGFAHDLIHGSMATNRLQDIFFNRLREDGNDIPEIAPETYLSARLTGLVKNAWYFSTWDKFWEETEHFRSRLDRYAHTQLSQHDQIQIIRAQMDSLPKKPKRVLPFMRKRTMIAGIEQYLKVKRAVRDTLNRFHGANLAADAYDEVLHPELPDFEKMKKDFAELSIFDLVHGADPQTRAMLRAAQKTFIGSGLWELILQHGKPTVKLAIKELQKAEPGVSPLGWYEVTANVTVLRKDQPAVSFDVSSRFATPELTERDVLQSKEWSTALAIELEKAAQNLANAGSLEKPAQPALIDPSCAAPLVTEDDKIAAPKLHVVQNK